MCGGPCFDYHVLCQLALPTLYHLFYSRLTCYTPRFQRGMRPGSPRLSLLEDFCWLISWKRRPRAEFYGDIFLDITIHFVFNISSHFLEWVMVGVFQIMISLFSLFGAPNVAAVVAHEFVHMCNMIVLFAAWRGHNFFFSLIPLVIAVFSLIPPSTVDRSDLSMIVPS